MRNFNSEEKVFLDNIVRGRNEGKDYMVVGSLFQKMAINEKVVIEINQKEKNSYFLSEKLDKLEEDGESQTKSNKCRSYAEKFLYVKAAGINSKKPWKQPVILPIC